MGQINLLPWREGYRKYLNRIFFIWLGLVSLVSLILVLIWVYVVAMVLEKQQLRNAYITDKISVNKYCLLSRRYKICRMAEQRLSGYLMSWREPCQMEST